VKARRKAGRTAAKTLVVEQVRAAEIEPDDAEISPEELPVEDRIRAAFGQVGASDIVSVQVYVVDRNNMPEQHALSLSPDDLDNIIERVRAECGAGKYRVRVYKNKRIATQFDFAIWAPARAAVPAASAQDTAVASMLEAVMKQNAELLQRLTTGAAGAVTVAPQTAVGLQDRIKETVEIVTALKALMPPPPPPMDFATLLPTIKSGLDFFRELVPPGGGGGDDNSLTGLLREGFKMAAPVLAQYAQGALPAPQSPPSMIDQPPPHAVEHRPPPPQNPAAAMLAQPLAYLVSRAAKGSEAEFYAEWALDNLPDAIDARQFVGTPPEQLLPFIFEIEPHAAQHREWFAALIAEMKAIVENPEPETDEHDLSGKSAATDTVGAAS
jgi:hypothetical protein